MALAFPASGSSILALLVLMLSAPFMVSASDADPLADFVLSGSNGAPRKWLPLWFKLFDSSIGEVPLLIFSRFCHAD
jgi:hypothetical protein